MQIYNFFSLLNKKSLIFIKKIMDLNSFIRDIPNFPKEGIVFKDITPLLGNFEAFQFCTEKLLEAIPKDINKVVAIDSRGFIFGGILAKELKVGFVPIRKKGKLPYNTISESYSLEYGESILEIHEDAIQPGDKVLLHDDILATGGTAQAACKLIEALGGEVVQCNFIISIDFLEGAKQLNSPVFALKKY